MKKLVKPTICAALSFVLMFTSVQWSGILAGPRRVNAEASKDVKEVIDSESTKNSTTFRLSNGKKESVFYGQDVRYEDENGNLKDYQYANKDGDKKQYLPKKLEVLMQPINTQILERQRSVELIRPEMKFVIQVGFMIKLQLFII